MTDAPHEPTRRKPALPRPVRRSAGLGLLCAVTIAVTAAAEGPVTPAKVPASPTADPAAPREVPDSSSPAVPVRSPRPDETVYEIAPLRHLPALEEEARRAAAARGRGAWRECAVAAANVAANADSLLAEGGCDPKRVTALRVQARKLLREAAPRLSPAEIAWAAAQSAPVAEFSLQYARALRAAGRGADAAAEALALLADEPAGPGAQEAVKLLAAAPGGPKPAGGVHHSVYHVAVFLSGSGGQEASSASLQAGLQLAVQEAEPESGMRVRLAWCFTGGDAAGAASMAREAIARGAGVFIGDVPPAPTAVLAAAAQASGIPLLSPADPDPALAGAGPAVFQTGLSGAEQGRALARYAVSELKAARVAVPANGGEFAAGFEQQAKALGAAVFRVIPPQGSRDARGAVNDLRRLQADALLLPADPGLAEIWIFALARERYATKLLGSEALEVASLHPDAQREAEGLALVGVDYALPEPVFAHVDSLVRQAHGFPADRFVRRGYLTGRLLAQILRDGAASPAMVAEALARRVPAPLDPRQGSWGVVGYPEGEAWVPIYVLRRGVLVRLR